MVVPPLAALAVAGTVVQFVDIGYRVLKTSVETYKSATGSSAANGQIQEDVDRLAKICDGFPAHSKEAPSGMEGQLLDFTVKCKELTREFTIFLQSLNAKQVGRPAIRSIGEFSLNSEYKKR